MKARGPKSNLPGRHQVFRAEDGDVIGLVGEDLPGRPLLEPVLAGGARVGARAADRGGARPGAAEEVAALPERRAGAARPRYSAAAALCSSARTRGGPAMSDAATGLIVVDVQNDFCPGGALGVAGGDRLGPAIAALAERAGTVVATRDWHPPDHSSFAEQGGPWPPHCVQGTPGAELHPSVAGLRIDRVQDVGVGPEDEGYSGFEGNDLAAYLRDTGRAARPRDGDRDRLLRARHGARRGPGGVRDDRLHRRDRRDRRRRRRRPPRARRGARRGRVARPGRAPARRGGARADPRCQGGRGCARWPHAAGRGRLDHRALGRDRLRRRARDRRPRRRRARRHRRAPAVPAHRAGASRRRRGDGGRRRPPRREPAHRLDRADPGGPRPRRGPTSPARTSGSGTPARGAG